MKMNRKETSKVKQKIFKNIKLCQFLIDFILPIFLKRIIFKNCFELNRN